MPTKLGTPLKLESLGLLAVSASAIATRTSLGRAFRRRLFNSLRAFWEQSADEGISILFLRYLICSFHDRNFSNANFIQEPVHGCLIYHVPTNFSLGTLLLLLRKPVRARVYGVSATNSDFWPIPSTVVVTVPLSFRAPTPSRS